MENHEIEIEDAKKRLHAHGKDPEAFTFELSFLPPDPDGGGMFTLRYVIVVTDKASGKSLETIGGIGLDWVGYFEEELTNGYFNPSA